MKEFDDFILSEIDNEVKEINTKRTSHSHDLNKRYLQIGTERTQCLHRETNTIKKLRNVLKTENESEYKKPVKQELYKFVKRSRLLAHKLRNVPSKDPS